MECASTTPEGFYIVSGLQEVSQNTPFQARPLRRCGLLLKLWQCAALLNILWMEKALYKFQLLLLLLLWPLLYKQVVFQIYLFVKFPTNEMRYVFKLVLRINLIFVFLRVGTTRIKQRPKAAWTVWVNFFQSKAYLWKYFNEFGILFFVTFLPCYS